jgi:hypothetical protein
MRLIYPSGTTPAVSAARSYRDVQRRRSDWDGFADDQPSQFAV